MDHCLSYGHKVVSLKVCSKLHHSVLFTRQIFCIIWSYFLHAPHTGIVQIKYVSLWQYVSSCNTAMVMMIKTEDDIIHCSFDSELVASELAVLDTMNRGDFKKS